MTTSHVPAGGGYTYHRTEPGLWTVGSGQHGTRTWEPESDWHSPQDAARQVARLNGSSDPDEIAQLRSEVAEIRAALAELTEWVKTLGRCGYCNGLGCARCV